MSESTKPQLEVCPSPAMLHLYDVTGSLVVIIDVLRATSTIATALYHGAARVIPVASVEECVRIGKELKAITAGERDGMIADGLQHGNSPFEYPAEFVEGKTLVLTTTNGTRLLHMAKGAQGILTGSFPNLSAVTEYLRQLSCPVILGCAAWKDRINIEDMLFAGAIVQQVRDHFYVNCDSALAAETLYERARKDLYGFMQQASHFERLSRYGLQEDIRYCLTPDVAPVLPVLENGMLVARKAETPA